MPEPTVYQVRAIDRRTRRERIVHAYETPELADSAKRTMGATTRNSYIVVPVENDPAQYWGIQFPKQAQ